MKGEYHFVSAYAEEDAGQDLVWIGFLFNLGGQTFIFWYPEAVVIPAVVQIAVFI
jgi:hypothetical protein